MRPSKGNFARDEVLAGHKWNDLFFLLYGERGGRDFFLERIENFGLFGKF